MDSLNSKADSPLMVTILCLVYNHEAYLRQCLDGFVSQRTNFRFEAVVHDDASTDGSAIIIKEYADKYPNIIKPIYEKDNVYSKQDGSLEKILINNANGKYVALCEGDDYWIDSFKLQKQFDLFESNSSISLCYSQSRIFYQKEGRFSDEILCKNGPTDFETLLFHEPAITLTSFFKASMYKKYFEEIRPQEKKWMMGDTPLWLYLANNGEIKLLQDITAVYRMSEESASHSKSIDYLLNFNESTMDIHRFFCIRYQRKDLLPKIKNHYHKSNMRDALQLGCPLIYLRNFVCLKNRTISDYFRLFKNLIQIMFIKLKIV